MKGKRVIAGILLAGILAVTLAGCKNTDNTKEETERPVITLGSDNYPPYNYLNEDGVPTGIDVELAAEAFKRMGYQVEESYIKVDCDNFFITICQTYRDIAHRCAFAYAFGGGITDGSVFPRWCSL